MRRRHCLPTLALFAAVAAFTAAPPAEAVHLFPLVPGDPAGDCGTGLTQGPGDSAGKVEVYGVFFEDQMTKSATTEIHPGQSVTWIWQFPHCHSVTAMGKTFGTYGGKPVSFGKEPELIKPDGNRNAFTVRFDDPGTYEYACVHHASVGMKGTVIVK